MKLIEKLLTLVGVGDLLDLLNQFDGLGIILHLGGVFRLIADEEGIGKGRICSRAYRM